jgi:hypothetical protein
MRVFVSRSIVALVVVATLLMSSASAAAAPAQSAPGQVVYSPPVDAAISDPFRPPATPYGPGNRGIEYATAPGTIVRAVADGTVTFVGVVAGRRWVTLRHGDGVRTTYGPLADFNVALGDSVHRGDPMGTTDGALMLTARIGDAYIDPASLFGGGPPRVHLVPEPIDPSSAPGTSHHGFHLPGSDALFSAIDWERRHLEATPAFIVSLTPAPVITNATSALLQWHEDQSTCTRPEVAPPPPSGRRLAILVGGLGSSSESAAVTDVNMAGVGYQPRDVVRFSYAGGRVPTPENVAPELSSIVAADYSPRDTVGDLEVAGHRLAEVLLRASEAAGPDVRIDVIAHSQGGVVARLALAELASSHPEALTHLGIVVTLGTPHSGADLAGLVQASDANPFDGPAVDAVRAMSKVPVAADDVAVRQLAPGSDLLTRLAATPTPAGVTVLSIAARGDLVVPSNRAHLDGATNVVVGVDGLTAHDQLPGSAATTREIGLALAGLGPTCATAADAVIDAVGGGLISNFEHALAVTQGG